jgi:hypothetical protein
MWEAMEVMKAWTRAPRDRRLEGMELMKVLVDWRKPMNLWRQETLPLKSLRRRLLRPRCRWVRVGREGDPRGGGWVQEVKRGQSSLWLKSHCVCGRVSGMVVMVCCGDLLKLGRTETVR